MQPTLREHPTMQFATRRDQGISSVEILFLICLVLMIMSIVFLHSCELSRSNMTMGAFFSRSKVVIIDGECSVGRSRCFISRTVTNIHFRNHDLCALRHVRSLSAQSRHMLCQRATASTSNRWLFWLALISSASSAQEFVRRQSWTARFFFHQCDGWDLIIKKLLWENGSWQGKGLCTMCIINAFQQYYPRVLSKEFDGVSEYNEGTNCVLPLLRFARQKNRDWKMLLLRS